MPSKTISYVTLGSPLSWREYEVLLYLATGRKNKEIAKAMGIGDRTVQTHTQRIYRRLGVDTRTAAVAQLTNMGVDVVERGKDKPIRRMGVEGQEWRAK